MTSITVSTREDDQDSHPKATLLDVSNGNSLCHSSDSGIHAPACSKPCDNDMVTVTHCRVAGGSLSSDEQDCASGENAAPIGLLDVRSVETGLSTLSLEVLTSGEHLNMLSQDDVSSCPGDASLRGDEKCEEDESLGGGGGKEEEKEGKCDHRLEEDWNGESLGGKYSDEGVQKEEHHDNDDDDDESPSDQGSPKEVGVIDSEQASQQSPPSQGSRCSSSMGYLEPRPSTQPPLGDQLPSPKEIQKKLMEKVTHLGTANEVTENQEAEEEMEEEVEEKEEEVKISSSQSSHSLQSTGSTTSATAKIFSFGSKIKQRWSFSRSRDRTSQTLAATSTMGLILHDRPKNLPAKSPAEEQRHQQLHRQMMAAARKKELQNAKEEVKREKMRRERDKVVADSLKEWEKIIPKWDKVRNSRKVQELWWQGLPPGVRGTVWKKAIGNDLNISSDLFVINLRRCKERLASPRDRSDSGASRNSVSREQSVEVIHLDVLRTFPTLGFFQEGGPYNKPLHNVLGAYACYRPDIGYVQGMSFLAAVLLLNMEAPDAFICLANLLNRSSYLAFFKVDHTLMQPYFSTFNILLQDTLPKLSSHFSTLKFSPEYYLIEWIFTIYTRALPLDVACRVWDLFCRDGDSFLFRTALGILKLFQSSLLEFRAIEDMGQFLGKLPNSIGSDSLFLQIDSIHFTTKRFKLILAQEQSRLLGLNSTSDI